MFLEKRKIIQIKKTILLLILLSVLFITSCNRNDFKIDVSGVDLNLTVNRFDVEMFNMDADSIYYFIPEMQKKYGDFFGIYNVQIIGVGLPEQKEYFNNLTDFYFYCDQMDLYGKVLDIFPPNDSYIKKSLTEAFKHYKYYFPNDSIPVINTCISGFNISVFTGENFIGISLDKYLGNFEPYKGMFEKYMVRRMKKEMLPVDVMKAWGMSKYPYNDSINTVMSKMIYEGKLQYFLDAMLPETSDTLKWSYTSLQWGWANEYEQNIWDYLVSEDLLFSKDIMNIKTFTDEAPFTTPFQNQSAPRAGNFIGYKIVNSFMENNKDITLEEFMKIDDYMYIYNNAYYAP